MNTLYFVRHGEGQDNVARQFSYKRVDRSLTERGRLQATQTADYLAGRPIDGIFCSPMKRAHETALIIARRLGKELTVLEEFREVNVGDLDGQPFNDESWGIYHDITNAWYTGCAHISYPNGEDYQALWQNIEYYNCAITELELGIVNGELQGRIVDWANTCHMSGEALTKTSAIPPLASIRRA